MPYCALTVTQHVPDRVVDELEKSFRTVAPETEVEHYLHKSAEVRLALFFIAGTPIWWGIMSYVKAFMAELGKRSAEYLYQWLKNRSQVKNALAAQSVRPLGQLAESLQNAADAGVREIYVGLPIPDEFWGTVLKLELDGAEHIAIQLAWFAENADKVEHAVRAELKSNEILGRVSLSIRDDGTFSLNYTPLDHKPGA